MCTVSCCCRCNGKRSARLLQPVFAGSGGSISERVIPSSGTDWSCSHTTASRSIKSGVSGSITMATESPGTTQRASSGKPIGCRSAFRHCSEISCGASSAVTSSCRFFVSTVAERRPLRRVIDSDCISAFLAFACILFSLLFSLISCVLSRIEELLHKARSLRAFFGSRWLSLRFQ